METEKTGLHGFELRRMAYGCYAKAKVCLREGLPAAQKYAEEALRLYESLPGLDKEEQRLCRELREIISG